MPDAQPIVPFRQTNSGGVPYQFAMKIIGRRLPKCAQQQQLPRGRLQQVGAPYYFGDPHRRVVDYHRQLISRNIVAAPDEEIAEVPSAIVSLLPQMMLMMSPCIPEPVAAARIWPGAPSRRA